MNEEIKERIKSLIKEREDFKQSFNEKDCDDFYHTFNAFKHELFDENKIPIYCEYDDGSEYSREFFVYDIKKDTLDRVNADEDCILRKFDDENFIIEQEDTIFLIAKDENNEIVE